jgi:serine/threonine protein kinase
MPGPTTNEQFLELVRKSGLVDETSLDPFLLKPWTLRTLVRALIHEGLLTHFQAEQLLQGKCRGFSIGKYKVLERLGRGAMGHVYLCEHTSFDSRVAVKVLPIALAKDPSRVERFYRGARAVAALQFAYLAISICSAVVLAPWSEHRSYNWLSPMSPSRCFLQEMQ